MRAVELPPGEHTLEFTFRLPAGPLSLSLAGLALTCGCLVWVGREGRRRTLPA
jgi:hypothetical protein